jgi:hypothetical protein
MIVAERQRPGAEAHRRSGEAMSQKRRGPAGPDREDESGREDAVRAEPGAGEASPVETVRPKAFGTGYELWVGLAVGFYVVYSAADLISGLVDSRLRLPLDFESEAVSTLDLPQSSVTLMGLTQISVPVADLGAAGITLVWIAKIVLILTVLGAGIAIVPVIRDIAAGTPFSARAIRALGVLEWIVAIGAVLYFATMTIGTNEVAFDLGIVKAVGPGITTMQAFVVLGIIGGAELLRRCFRSGQAAQEELEGLV